MTGGILLEFNITVPLGQFVWPADWVLLLPARFRTEDNVPIDLERYIPVNNFFGHCLETLTILLKDNMKPIVRPRPSGSITTYMRSIMEDMTPDQLAVIENDVLFDRSKVTGENLHYSLHDGDQPATYYHLLLRRNGFAPVVAGAENWVIGRAIPEGNLISQDIKYVIPMRLLNPFFSTNKQISLDLVVQFSLEQDTKKLFEAIVATVEKISTEIHLGLDRLYLRRQKYITTRTHLHQDKQLYTTW